MDDRGSITRVRLTEIDKKLPFDRKAFTKDSIGNVLSIDDVVKVSAETSPYRFRKGVVKNICKNCLFLWDPKGFTQSSGLFVENPRNVLILGTEFLKTDATT